MAKFRRRERITFYPLCPTAVAAVLGKRLFNLCGSNYVGFSLILCLSPMPNVFRHLLMSSILVVLTLCSFICIFRFFLGSWSLFLEGDGHVVFSQFLVGCDVSIWRGLNITCHWFLIERDWKLYSLQLLSPTLPRSFYHFLLLGVCLFSHLLFLIVPFFFYTLGLLKVAKFWCPSLA